MSGDLRGRLLEAWGRGVTTHPAITLWCCGLLAAASVLLAVNRIELHSDRSDLVDPRLEWNARYAIYRADFPRWNDLIVCLDGPADDHEVDDFARMLARDLQTHDQVHRADAGFLASEAGPRLYLTSPADAFAPALNDLVYGARLAQAESPVAALDELFTTAQSRPTEDVSFEELAGVISPFIDGLNNRNASFDLLESMNDRWQPLVTNSGRIRLVMVSLAQNEEASVDALSRDLAWLRTTIKDLLVKHGHDDLEWGITGIPAMEADETAQAIADSTVASIVAFLLVTGLLLLVFRHWMIPLLAATALVIGIAWSFAWVVISVGHLQLLSVIFSAILIGLGIDFALHLIARLRLVEGDHPDLPAAMGQTFRDVGPGLLTGAITTAAAFGCTAFTAFLGVAETGIIASGGVLLCLGAVMCAFPAMLALLPRWRQRVQKIRSVSDHGFPQLVAPFESRPVITLLAGGLIGAGMVMAAIQVRYDPNLLNLQPPGLESVQWAKRLAEEPGADLWSGLIMTEPESAPELVVELRNHAQVEEVTGMGILYPPQLSERLAKVKEAASRLEGVSNEPDRASTLVTQLRFLANGLKQRDELPAADQPAASALINQIEAALDEWSSIDSRERSRRYERLKAAWKRGAQEARPWFASALSGHPPGADDLPRLLQELWIGQDGQWLLRVAPRVDERSVLEPQRLNEFVEGVREVAPDVLGSPVQIYESTILIINAYLWSALLALGAILLVLFLDFRRPLDVFCAMLPVLIGFAGTFAIMTLFGLPVNFANLMVMPMILGIGVDAGVHAVHRWRSDPSRSPAGLWGGTGQGISLTLLTTGIAFASLLIADHRAVQSLATVMIIGLGVTFIATITILPAILRIRSN